MLKKFGDPEWSRHYDLGHCIGELESLCFREEDTLKSTNGPKARRLNKVMDALALLEEAYEMGNEE